MVQAKVARAGTLAGSSGFVSVQPVSSESGRQGFLEELAERRLQQEYTDRDPGEDEDACLERLLKGEPVVSGAVVSGESASVTGGSCDAGLGGRDCAKQSCLAKVCGHFGVNVGSGITSVGLLPEDVLLRLAQDGSFKLLLFVYGVDDPRNHIQLVSRFVKSARIEVSGPDTFDYMKYTIVCTSTQDVFQPGGPWHGYSFYASMGEGGDFGGDVPLRNARAASQFGAAAVAAPPSVVDESAGPGGSNVSGGVVRSGRRVIAGKSVPRLGVSVAKNYRTAATVMFNNVDELFQDMVSRELAQEIIEKAFDLWSVPMDQPEATKFAEDVLWMFLVAVTASNKADYARVYDIPVRPIVMDGEDVSSVGADFGKFSNLLEAEYNVSRRQFARGVADDIRQFLRHEENSHLLPRLAVRVGCDIQMAHLAFDGSTHCTGMTPREIAFTKTLESRNLFENDAVLAQGASDRLMQGFSTGPRAIR